MKNFLLIIALISFGYLGMAQAVTTQPVTNIGGTTATFNADGTVLDGAESYYVKFYWRVSGGAWDPDTKNSATYSGGAASHSFTYDMINLTANTDYDVACELYESDGLGYTKVSTGAAVSFTTLATTPPSVTTGTAGSITASAVTIAGNNVTAEGTSSVTERGVCAGSSASPTARQAVLSGGAGLYDKEVTGASANTTYYFRAYAESDVDVSYGADRQVKTAPGVPNADAGDEITATTFKAHWHNGDGGSSGITYELYVSKNSDLSSPIGGYAPKTMGTATEEHITGLDVGTDYYYGVKAINDGGPDAGDNITAVSSSVNVKTGAAGLPIELIDFTATLESKSVMLAWVTASEENNDYFEIVRSFDNENYTSIARVNGAGNSNIIMKYTTTDNEKFDGVAFYKLKQTDYDGQYVYSQAVSVKRVSNQELDLSDYTYDGSLLKLDIHNPNNEVVKISLIDISGKIVGSLKSNSTSQVQFNANNLSKGVYIINITSENSNIVKKIVL